MAGSLLCEERNVREGRRVFRARGTGPAERSQVEAHGG